MLKPNPDRSLHLTLWGLLVVVLSWSLIGCHDYFTWWMEAFPFFIGTALLVAVYDRFRFTRLVCYLMFFHAIVLIVGAHYTYAEVPAGHWVKDLLGLARNPYDRLGHFMQGLVPAMVSREILIRNRVVKSRGWLNFIVISICLAFSALYELLEWQTAVWTGEAAESFLGTQGDVWDTQWDMALALIGASTALLLLSGAHDRQLEKTE
jgi:putative membrane protein